MMWSILSRPFGAPFATPDWMLGESVHVAAARRARQSRSRFQGRTTGEESSEEVRKTEKVRAPDHATHGADDAERIRRFRRRRRRVRHRPPAAVAGRSCPKTRTPEI